MSAALTVPVRRLAKMLDLGPRRVQQLADEGVFPKTDRGRYDVDACVLAYVRYMFTGPAAAGVAAGPEDLLTAKTRKTSAEADIATLNAAERRGELVEVAEIALEARTAMIEIRQRMLQVPERVAGRVLGETDERRLKTALREEISAALAALADAGDAAEAVPA